MGPMLTFMCKVRVVRSTESVHTCESVTATSQLRRKQQLSKDVESMFLCNHTLVVIPDHPIRLLAQLCAVSAPTSRIRILRSSPLAFSRSNGSSSLALRSYLFRFRHLACVLCRRLRRDSLDAKCSSERLLCQIYLLELSQTQDKMYLARECASVKWRAEQSRHTALPKMRYQRT